LKIKSPLSCPLQAVAALQPFNHDFEQRMLLVKAEGIHTKQNHFPKAKKAYQKKPGKSSKKSRQFLPPKRLTFAEKNLSCNSLREGCA